MAANSRIYMDLYLLMDKAPKGDGAKKLLELNDTVSNPDAIWEGENGIKPYLTGMVRVVMYAPWLAKKDMYWFFEGEFVEGDPQGFGRWMDGYKKLNFLGELKGDKAVGLGMLY